MTRACGLALVLGLLGAARAWSAAPAACPATTAFADTLDHFEGYRVFTGKDGDSEVAPYRIDARQVPLLKTGKILGIIDLPTAPKRAVQVVIGPPNVDLPLHAAPYREMFIMLAGSVTLSTAKFKAELKPGSVLLFEDVDAKVGHGGRTGPCGYTSLSIAP